MTAPWDMDSFDVYYTCTKGYLDDDELVECEFEGFAGAYGGRWEYEVTCPECGYIETVYPTDD